MHCPCVLYVRCPPVCSQHLLLRGYFSLLNWRLMSHCDHWVSVLHEYMVLLTFSRIHLGFVLSKPIFSLAQLISLASHSNCNVRQSI